jgi:hypothetical protein
VAQDFIDMPSNHTLPRNSSWTLLIITVCSLCFLAASLIAPLIHKHCPTHAADVQDYDASCYWIKTIKSHRCNTNGFDPQIYLFSLFCLLLAAFILLYTLEDVAACYHRAAPLRLVSVRGPPAVLR